MKEIRALKETIKMVEDLNAAWDRAIAEVRADVERRKVTEI